MTIVTNTKGTLMFTWLQRWQERRITRAWLRQGADDRKVLEEHFTYETDESGITIMTPKPRNDERTEP